MSQDELEEFRRLYSAGRVSRTITILPDGMKYHYSIGFIVVATLAIFAGGVVGSLVGNLIAHWVGILQ